MRLERNPQTGAEWFLTSWRVANDPSTGAYRRVLEAKGLPESVSWSGDVKKYRLGPWNGLRFGGVPEMASYSELVSIQVVTRPDENAFIFTAKPGAPFSSLVVNEFDVMQRLAWDPTSRAWNVFAQSPRDACDSYAMCGAFGLCSLSTMTTQYCSCAEGFSPVSPSRWAMREASSGCRRDVPLECGNGTMTDGFMLVRDVKLPDTDNVTVDMSASLEQCRVRCLANCSCVAYAATDIRGGGGGSGCVMWTHDIVDVRSVDGGQDLYLRLAKSELVTGWFLVWIWCKLRGKRRNKGKQKKMMLRYLSESEFGDENLELPFFNFGEIATATNNFSDDNMLGQGGFGKVYKGLLDKNKQVAIKDSVRVPDKGKRNSEMKLF